MSGFGLSLDNTAAIAARAARAAFRDSYLAFAQDVDPVIKDLMLLAQPSDKLSESYPYRETAPYIERWKDGEAIPEENYGDASFSVTNYVWGKRVSWKWEDEYYDQLGGLVEDARGLGKHAAFLPEDIFWQMLLSTTDPDLLPAVPNAADGASLFNANDGDSNDRFGISGGNIVSGGGVGTAAAVRADFYKIIRRFNEFQDKRGKPLYQSGMIDRSTFTIVAGVHLQEVFEEAFKQTITLDTAGVSNTVVVTQKKLRFLYTQRIASSDNDWFVFTDAAPKKPFLEQVVTPFSDNVTDFENSDITRTWKKRSYQTQAIMGYGIGPAYGGIQLNN